MKNMKKYLFPCSLVLLMTFTWLNVLDGSGKDAAVCAGLIEKAQLNEEKEAFITAAGYYVKASEYTDDSTELLLLAAENFLKCGEDRQFVSCCRTAAENTPLNEKPWIMLGEYYLKRGEAGRTVEFLSEVPDEAMTDNILDVIARAESSFRKGYRTFIDAKPFYNGYCAVKDRDMWGLSDEQGSICILPEYDDIGAYNADEDAVPVCRNGEWCFINAENQVKYVPSENYTYLGALGSGYAPFCCDGKYGYTDMEYNERSEKYDFAGAFSEGVAAVSRDGMWALISPEMTHITDYVYDYIETDRYGFCCRGGVIRAVKSGERVFLSSNGEEISDGKVFSCGLAPADCGEFQGYENKNGDMVIDAFFDEVTDFSDNGRAIVCEDGRWKVITLDMYR